MRVQGSVDPPNLQKRGNPDREPRKWDLASKDLTQLNCPITEKAQSAGAEILKLHLEEWSMWRLVRCLGVSYVTMTRLWHRAGLQPHRVRRYMASPDPQFEVKAKDILGL